MEVILLQDIENLGNRGQIVKVADGYGRNFLLPKKIAVAATPQSRKWVEQQRVRFLKLEAKEKGDAGDLAKIMEGTVLTFKRKTGEHGNLFGSVTAIDVADGLAAHGYHIDRRRVQVANPLKVIGEYDVPVKLHRDVTTTVKVKVESDAPPAATAQPEPAEPAAAPPPAQAAETEKPEPAT
jgi:large subunit ribosomal protein L9